jgi:hypothetical protein
LRSLFFHCSGEACREGDGTDQIDRPDDIVGEHAERCFTTDFSKSSGEEPPAGGHSFYGSEGVFRSASALADQARISVETGVHSFERILMLMATDKATLCGGTSRLE